MLTLFSPAKLNLFLRVLRKREDGYHDLASLFQAINFGDTITFSFAREDTLSCSDRRIPTGHSNLVSKALKLFREKTGERAPLAIHLEKQIPPQSGLGGGSSNAATTLWALNALFGHPATLSDLFAWAAELGSDVSFFFSQGTAYCRGRGEIVEKMPPPPLKEAFWIVIPPYHLSTSEMFERLILRSSPLPEECLDKLLAGEPHFHNDFEEPALTACPALGELCDSLLKSGFSTATLTGSGAAFFCTGNPHQRPSNAYPVEFLRRPEEAWYQTAS